MVRPLILLAIIVALAVGAAAQPAQAQDRLGRDGVVAIDCDGATGGIQESCVYDTGETFLVQVNIAEAPPGGYNGFELRVSWTVPQLAYRPAEEFEEEFLEEGCATVGRSSPWAVGPWPEVAFICLNPPGSDVRLSEGVPIEFAITCWAEGTGALSLTDNPASLWIRGIDTVDKSRPRTSDASVTCRPKSGQLGDIDCGGTVDSVDAALVLQFSAGLLEPLSCDYKGDMTQNGRLDSRDALLILQNVAGLI